MEDNNPLLSNNNSNNLPPLLINIFRFGEGFNLSLDNNNNNNLSLEGLDPKVILLVNALIGLNLTKGYYLKEGSFIKLTEFERTKIENLNK